MNETVYDLDETDFDQGGEYECWYCHGEGWGIVDLDFPCHDPLWNAPGDVLKCPNCRGSGKAEDCWFW